MDSNGTVIQPFAFEWTINGLFGIASIHTDQSAFIFDATGTDGNPAGKDGLINVFTSSQFNTGKGSFAARGMGLAYLFPADSEFHFTFPFVLEDTSNLTGFFRDATGFLILNGQTVGSGSPTIFKGDITGQICIQS
jgi:hypothetical protein